MSDEPRDDPLAATPDAPSTWKDVARVALHHHLRGPWPIATALVALASILVVLAGVFAFPRGTGGVGAGEIVTAQTFPLASALPVLALMLVLPAYRGPWLWDPAAARERVGGFFAGTWAALVVVLGGWALVSMVLAAFWGPATDAIRAGLVHFVGLSLLAGVWVALALLVTVSFHREETRWVGAFVVWAGLSLLLPYASEAAVAAWRFSDGAIGDRFMAFPGWAFLLDLLSPATLREMLAEPLSNLTPFGAARQDAYGFLGTPVVAFVALALWIALPLFFAVRAQAKGEGAPPAHVPF